MQFCASFPVCHVCLMEEEEARLLKSSPPELEPHFAAASFLPVRHGSSLARSLAAGFIILRGAVRWRARGRKKKMRWITWMESGLKGLRSELGR